jgi:hypothetical protein
VIHSINMDVLVRAHEAISIGTKLDCSESANASDTCSARKGLRFDPVRRVPATEFQRLLLLIKAHQLGICARLLNLKRSDSLKKLLG